MSLNGFSQTDSTIHLSLRIGRLIESDLRLLDSAIVLVGVQDTLIAMQNRQILTKDSIINYKTIESRAFIALCQSRVNDAKAGLIDERKRRKANGWWRNLFILTTAGAIYLAITSQ